MSQTSPQRKKTHLFDDKYDDNIARVRVRVAPELKESFIYRAFGHIGADKKSKNIGNALQRCWYDTAATYTTHWHLFLSYFPFVAYQD